MKQTILFFFSFLVVMKFSCKPANKVRGVNLTQTFPDITTDGKVTGYDTSSVQMYYQGDQQLIRTPYYNTTNGVREILYNYFVFRKGDKTGFKFFNGVKGKFSVDSFFRKSWIAHFDFYHLFVDDSVRLLLSKKLGKDSLYEMYEIAGKVDTSMHGTISLQYSKKLNGIDFSLAKPLDSIKKIKLCTVNIVNNARYIEKYQWSLDRVEEEWTLREIPVSPEIISYFQLAH